MGLFGALYPAYIYLCRTLRLRSCGRPRMTRGQDGSPLLILYDSFIHDSTPVYPDAPQTDPSMRPGRVKGIPVVIDYSFRSAVVGSSPAARRAGRNDASIEITRNSTATDAKVTGSIGLTSTSMLARMRVDRSD